MKKLIPLCLSVLLLVGLTACSGGSEENRATTATSGSESAAQKSDKTGAALFEIEPEEPYTDADLDYNNDSCRANQEQNDPNARPAIAGDTLDLSGYDTIYLGYPIWWGDAPMIIRTFCDAYDLSGKTIAPFCTSGGSGISQSVSTLESLEPDATITDGLRTSPASADSDLDSWLEAIA